MTPPAAQLAHLRTQNGWEELSDLCERQLGFISSNQVVSRPHLRRSLEHALFTGRLSKWEEIAGITIFREPSAGGDFAAEDYYPSLLAAVGHLMVDSAVPPAVLAGNSALYIWNCGVVTPDSMSLSIRQDLLTDELENHISTIPHCTIADPVPTRTGLQAWSIHNEIPVESVPAAL